MNDPSPVSVGYFQAGPHVNVRRRGVATSVEIAPPVHAKSFGTRHTACGLAADTWVKAWSTPFEASAPGMCPDCVEAVVTTDT